ETAKWRRSRPMQPCSSATPKRGCKGEWRDLILQLELQRPLRDTSPGSRPRQALGVLCFSRSQRSAGYSSGGAERRAAEDLDRDLGGFGGRATDPYALGFERLGLGRGRPGAARDDRAGVAHLLARRGGEAGDVGDHRLAHVLGDVLRRL